MSWPFWTCVSEYLPWITCPINYISIELAFPLRLNYNVILTITLNNSKKVLWSLIEHKIILAFTTHLVSPKVEVSNFSDYPRSFSPCLHVHALSIWNMNYPDFSAPLLCPHGQHFHWILSFFRWAKAESGNNAPGLDLMGYPLWAAHHVLPSLKYTSGLLAPRWLESQLYSPRHRAQEWALCPAVCIKVTVEKSRLSAEGHKAHQWLGQTSFSSR